MSRRIITLAILALALTITGVLTSSASANPAPAWQARLISAPTTLTPGLAGNAIFPQLNLIATNVGGAPTAGTITGTIELPDGVTSALAGPPSVRVQGGSGVCTGSQTVTCTLSSAIDPGSYFQMMVPVDTEAFPDPTIMTALASVFGGGGASPASTSIPVTVSNAIAPPGLLPGDAGLNASVAAEDGSFATQAGTHPQQLNVNFGVATQPDPNNNGYPDTNGALHDARIDLPSGMIVDPSATPKCTMAQLITLACPASSQVGVAAVPLAAGGIINKDSGLYNMVPPPGYAASFGFIVEGVAVPVSILGGVRPGDYRITSVTPDSLGLLAVFAALVQLWGSPSDASHDGMRGACGTYGGVPGDSCPVTRTEKPLIALPTSCAPSMQIDAHIDLWEDIGNFQDATVDLSDANGNPTAVTGCDAVQFAPGLKARPTTNLADSPTGLSVDLHILQTDGVDELATAHLRKAVVALPEGLLLNPASANGLDGCDPDEVGIDPGTGVPDGAPVTCPDASRIGTVEVDTPLLEHALPGSVFVATPHDNPFDSLLAIYLVVDDPQTNTLVKLSGHVVPDPQTGQLITTFDNNPQIPFEHFRLDFFAGAYAPLRTPATCGTYSTTSQMTSWAASEEYPRAPSTPKDTWQISQGPGGSCATTESAQPHTPTFDAGSASVIAGQSTPFVLHLRRNDATQQFSALTVSPPPGLVAKLAGTEACSDAVLDAATQKTGKAEQANPSCPANSQVGTFVAATGAGPAPYNAPGKVYLSGPYKGAPLSFAFVAPAVAGPYDLGTIVTKAAVYIDRETAKVTTVPDPLPEILEGIVLDVRSVDVSLDRPNFTRNGTSCDPLAVTGTLTSTLGQKASLESRFQLAECRRLAFKPRLKLTLKGATKRTSNPRLIANLTAKPDEANIARAQVKLPTAAFLDNSHIKTICTRVQFAADTCPEESIYGSASATSPILDYTVSGPVYLRSSSNPLPDLVVKLKGPDSQPIEVDLVGRTDSVKGALRNSFEAVPDVPVSTFHLELFGGRRGLVELSRNLCKGTYRAAVHMEAQNGDTYDATPRVGDSCKGKGKKKSKKRHHAHS